MSLDEYWRIIKRRRWLFSIPAIGIMLIVTFFALSMQDIYRSEATILIEDQDIPEDFIGATMRNYASQQIQLISQRLFTAANIRSMVEEFDVYATTDDDGERIPDNELVDYFRDDLELDLVSEQVINERGIEVESAIAFTLAFNSDDPEIAQQVTEELVTMFLNENQRSSAVKAAGVSELLKTAVGEANEELREAEAALTSFKLANDGALPEMRQLNLDAIGRAEQLLSDLSLRLQELEQRKLQLSVQLSSLSPTAPVTLPSGETVMSDRDRLQALLVDYRRKSAVYQAGHPDLVRLEREIGILRQSVGGTETSSLLAEQLQQERDRLRGLRERYSADHPDVRSSEAAIRQLESQVAVAGSGRSAAEEVADNPAYILINTQLQSVELEARSIRQKRRELQATIDKHQALMEKTPRIEGPYQELLRAAENASTKYADLQSKFRAAEVAADMEQGITGQRFVLIEPPLLPLEPESQNLPAFLLLGALLAVGIGTACVVIAELADDSIRTARSLTRIVGAAPLAVIPYLDNSEDLAHVRSRRMSLAVAFFAGTALCVVYVIYAL
ncbi:MAG: hypothetical protein KJO19_02495 [Woeseia sp.]|nr:hypothetical protein [Woeseia sp.]